MDLTVRKFLRYLSLEKRYSPKTIESYTIDLTQFSKFLEELSDGNDIIWNKVRKFDQSLQQILMDKTSHNHTKIHTHELNYQN